MRLNHDMRDKNATACGIKLPLHIETPLVHQLILFERIFQQKYTISEAVVYNLQST